MARKPSVAPSAAAAETEVADQIVRPPIEITGPTRQEAISGAAEALRYLQDEGTDTPWPPIEPLATRRPGTQVDSVSGLIGDALARLAESSTGHAGWTVGLVAAPTTRELAPQTATAVGAAVLDPPGTIADVVRAAPALVAQVIGGSGDVRPLTSSQRHRRSLEPLVTAHLITRSDASLLSTLVEADDPAEALDRAAANVESALGGQLVQILQAVLSAVEPGTNPVQDTGNGLHPLLDRSTIWSDAVDGCLAGAGFGAVLGGPWGAAAGCVVGGAARAAASGR